MNKAQQVTYGIKHWGLSGYVSILPRIKFGVTGQESSPQSPTISYRQPLPAKLKKTTVQTKMRIDKLKIKNQKQIIRVNGFYSFGLTIN